MTPAALPPDLRRRVLDAAAQSDPPPTRRASTASRAILLAVGASGLLAIFLWWGGLRAAPRPASLVVLTSIGSTAIAAIATWFAFGRGRSMLGPPREWLVIGSLLVPILLLAWKVGISASYPDMIEEWPTRAGFRCLRLSLSSAVLPLVALLFARRASDPNHPALTGAALGVASGACTWVAVDLWCPVGYVPHLLLGHVLPIVVFAMVGAVLGSVLLPVRSRPSP